jgi:hypothetical protein
MAAPAKPSRRTKRNPQDRARRRRAVALAIAAAGAMLSTVVVTQAIHPAAAYADCYLDTVGEPYCSYPGTWDPGTYPECSPTYGCDPGDPGGGDPDPVTCQQDEDRSDFTLSAIWGVSAQFNPFIKYCWNSTGITSITKYSPPFRWCEEQETAFCTYDVSIRLTSGDPQPFIANGIGQYVVGITVDMSPPISGLFGSERCNYVIDRVYYPGGGRQNQDKLLSCSSL